MRRQTLREDSNPHVQDPLGTTHINLRERAQSLFHSLVPTTCSGSTPHPLPRPDFRLISSLTAGQTYPLNLQFSSYCLPAQKSFPGSLSKSSADTSLWPLRSSHSHSIGTCHSHRICYVPHTGFPGGSVVKPPANLGGVGSIPGSGRSPGGGNGNPPAGKIPGTEEPGGL